MTQQITADAQDALAAAPARALLVALLSSAVTCAVVFRRRRAVLEGTAVVAIALAVSAGVATTTLRIQALDEPKFDGLLAQAPALMAGCRTSTPTANEWRS